MSNLHTVVFVASVLSLIYRMPEALVYVGSLFEHVTKPDRTT